jgi:hypothetical protein
LGRILGDRWVSEFPDLLRLFRKQQHHGDTQRCVVGLERVNKVLRFDFSKRFSRARGEVVPLPTAAAKLPNNVESGEG